MDEVKKQQRQEVKQGVEEVPVELDRAVVNVLVGALRTLSDKVTAEKLVVWLNDLENPRQMVAIDDVIGALQNIKENGR